MTPVTDDNGELYAGCWVLATIRAFPNKHPTNLGPRFGLQGVQKFADDEPFTSRGNPADDFVPLEDDMSAEDADDLSCADVTASIASTLQLAA